MAKVRKKEAKDKDSKKQELSETLRMRAKTFLKKKVSIQIHTHREIVVIQLKEVNICTL